MFNFKNYRNYLKRLLIIAVPMILSHLINQLQMLIDRIFLGHADTLYMSVLGNVSFPVWTTMAVCFSISTGASILISQNVGADKKEKVEEFAGSLIKYNNILPLGLFFLWFFASKPVYRLMGVSENLLPMCEDYSRYYAPVFILVGFYASFMVIFQTSNHTKHLAISSFIRSVLNIFLDWVLIFGKLGFPAMGIKGAAIGTTIAEYAGGIYTLIAFYKSRKLGTRPNFAAIFKSRFKSYLHSAKLGINTALEDLFWNLGNLAIIRILNSINELAAGIYTIVFGVEIIAIVVIGSLGSGTMTLSSEAVGKHDLRLYRGITRTAYSLCILIALAMVITALLFPQQIIAIFTKDQGIIATSGIYLLFIGINLFSKAGNIIVGNVIRGSGDTRWMFFTQIFGTFFVVAMACLFVFGLKLGITGVFLAVMSDEAVRFVINTLKYRRICKSADFFEPEKEHLSA
ncbi:MAG: MATE family efflux transporter [Treponema sp.]|nr:MATE family efflux transporter [Treponema sp.]